MKNSQGFDGNITEKKVKVIMKTLQKTVKVMRDTLQSRKGKNSQGKKKQSRSQGYDGNITVKARKK